jgi:dolichol-phosphate mannosyltransferase|tara:strand:+ start:1843 stop:2565 length:723 start_codon:yes stop_codon:yes gene_type:complete
MSNNILIFAATFNEIENIEDFINEINKLNYKVDILIIDDNSPDGTGNLIDKIAKRSKNHITLIRREKKLGLDTAHKFAYNYAIENNFTYLITLDADLSHEPKEITNILNHLKNTPFVIGSRYMKGGGCYMKGWRLLISIYGNKFIKKILSINSREFTSSFRGFNLKQLSNFNLNLVNSSGYSFFMETLFRLDEKKYPIFEIPIQFRPRKHGFSKISKIEIFRALKNVFLLFFFKLFKRKG